MPNPNLDASILFPYLGKEAEAMLTLWKAQMEWIALTNPARADCPERSNEVKNAETTLSI
jgi:hypothetical protein